MVEVVCDTSFLIHMANSRIKNISILETEIGQINFTVPIVVLNELKKLSHDSKKGLRASHTLKFIRNFKQIEITGTFADSAILEYVKRFGGIVATMDKDLKNKLKNLNGSIISISNDRIVLES